MRYASCSSDACSCSRSCPRSCSGASYQYRQMALDRLWPSQLLSSACRIVRTRPYPAYAESKSAFWSLWGRCVCAEAQNTWKAGDFAFKIAHNDICAVYCIPTEFIFFEYKCVATSRSAKVQRGVFAGADSQTSGSLFKKRPPICLPALGVAKTGGNIDCRGVAWGATPFCPALWKWSLVCTEIIGLIFITPPSLSVFLRLRRCWRSERGGKQIDFKLKAVLNGSPQFLTVMLTPKTTMKSGNSSQGVEDYWQKLAKGKRLFLFVPDITSTSDSNDQLFFFESLQFVASLILPPLKMLLNISAGEHFPTEKQLVKSLLIFR